MSVQEMLDIVQIDEGLSASDTSRIAEYFKTAEVTNMTVTPQL